jgi:hypothetical protein
MNHQPITHRPLRYRRPATLLLPFLVAGAMSMAACGDDEQAVAEAPATSAAHSHEPSVVTITATDYAFEDVPASMPAGSKLSIKNVATTELHEIVAFRVPDAETRPLAELMTLPQPELMAALGGAPRAVMLQAPGSTEVINAVGDGILGEPGRYVILCGIPTGADPGEYLAAAAASHGAPPQGVPGGPPHLVNGMFAEFMVE